MPEVVVGAILSVWVVGVWLGAAVHVIRNWRQGWQFTWWTMIVLLNIGFFRSFIWPVW